jgi:hypothetical protein
MDATPTDQDVDELNEAIRQSRRANEEKDVTGIDHPWHAYLPWKNCYNHDGMIHWTAKDKNNHFPSTGVPMYYQYEEMMNIIHRRRSTGQLQAKN